MALSLEDTEMLVMLIRRLKADVSGLKQHVAELESRPHVVSYGGGTRSFTQLKDTIADAQTPNTLLVDGSRAMTGNLKFSTILLKDGTDYLHIKNLADNDWRSLRCGYIYSDYGINTGSITGMFDQDHFFNENYNTRIFHFCGRNTISVYVDVASISTGAEPKFNLIQGNLTGDLDVSANNIGPLLIDRTTATKYRLYVDNGVLDIEAV